MTRNPADGTAGEGIVGDQRGKSPSRRGPYLTSASADDPLDGIEHFLHRGAVSGPEVQGVAGAVLQKMLDRTRVRIGKVEDVDEIANTGAIPRIIVGAENLKLRPAAQRCIHRDRDSVRFRRVPFSNPAFRVSTSGIEIAQDEGAESLIAIQISQGLFDDELGLPVWIDRLLGMCFVHRSR